MIYRRRKAMRFEKLLWITKGAASRVGFLSNKYTPSRGRGLNACISSRITTVIHVASHHQINYNWFNEPFAVSPYNWFILRHAWLNLWDKHMTTGRINQVTTFPLSRNCSAKSSVHDPSNTCYQPLLVAFLVRSLSLDQWAILTMTPRSFQLVQPTKQLKINWSDHPYPPVSQVPGPCHSVTFKKCNKMP